MTITGIGETVLDIVFRSGQPQAAVPGGSTFNAMISLGRTLSRHGSCPREQSRHSRLDRESPALRMVTQTGDDAVAEMVLSFMEDNGVGTGCVVRSPGQTTVSLALLDERSNAHYEFFRDKDLPPFAAPELDFEPGDLVLFGSFFAINPETREQARSLVRKARAAGACVYYDINFRKNHNAADSLPQIEGNIALSDIVRGSSEDIEALYGTEDAAAVYRDHIAPLCPNFICTKGARETEVFSPGVQLSFPVPQDTPVVSTIGAGDNFNAGVLYALAWKSPLSSSPALTATASGGRCGEGSIPLRVDQPLSEPSGRRSPIDWHRIVPIAHRFSANVVASLYNYVDPDFEP